MAVSHTRQSKRAKTVSTANIAWQHYRNFLDSAINNDGEGDIDEINELLEVIGSDVTAPLVSIAMCKTQNNFLDILLSLAHYHLAQHAIDSGDSSEEILRHLRSSLEFVPNNPAAWSLGASYARTPNNLVALSMTVEWYRKAAASAAEIRAVGVRMMDGDLNVDNSVKEWVEVLILDGLAGVEYLYDEEEEQDDTEFVCKGNGDSGYFSTSAVEATSRFMSAMLLSTLGEHDSAMEELKHFDLSHRLTPEVWTQAKTCTNAVTNTFATTGVPCVFRGQVLPDPLYQRMCQLFNPDAIYWEETNYAHRGYYSYFLDMIEKPSNILEQVIFEHLLPNAQRLSPEQIVGAEWWVHTRPIQANLGHNLHFDTDEALLMQSGEITHPVLSSVLYLTGNATNSESSPAGSTIVLDQTPDSQMPASTCYLCPPRDNTLLVFPGNMLHGVLPCPVTEHEPSTLHSNTVSLNWNKSNMECNQPPPVHRLTFMVGFWTRCVPDKMKERSLYGPCGPMPVDSDWMKGLYPIVEGITPVDGLTAAPLTTVSPAWESIPNSNDESVPLTIPQGMDHGFFVKGAPRCFRDAMFPDDDVSD